MGVQVLTQTVVTTRVERNDVRPVLDAVRRCLDVVLDRDPEARLADVAITSRFDVNWAQDVVSVTHGTTEGNL